MLTLATSSDVLATAERDTASASDISFSNTVTLLSDYIYRGQSQTWGKPALQYAVEMAHTSGMYGGLFVSTVSNQWVPGAHVETDWYAGYRDNLPGAMSGIAYDLNLLYVYYPGGNFNKTGFVPRLQSSTPNATELSIALTHHWLTVKTGAVLTDFYGWNTNNSPLNGGFAGDPSAGVTGNTRGSWFLEANTNWDLGSDWSVNGQIGQETIRHSQNLDWRYYKIGASKKMGNWTASLAYSASSQPAAFRNFVGLTNNGSTYSPMRPRIVATLSNSF
ncbi:MAG: TorF family putative porin [Gallionella sp.]|nr:TorF family putative porin [Gallionella sp.]